MIKIPKKLPKDLKMKSTNTGKIAADVAKILLETGCVIIRSSTPFKFDSGILSPIYVDNRLLISSPQAREKIIKLLVNLAKKMGEFDSVAGVATAGIPHAAWIADALNLPMVYVREVPKTHGRQNQVEGKVKRGQKVLVVEDMISTAGSSVNVIKALRKLGAVVDNEIAIYSHGLAQAEKNFKKIKINFFCLTTLSNVVRAAVKYEFLRTTDDVSSILNWAKDPKNWGKKMGFE